jgi:cytochrome P450
MSKKNLLSTWTNDAYKDRTFGFNLLKQHYFVCNSPESVRRVFLDEHDNYDRKSPQMRHALEPLLGDGLFVSDGELWKQRRAYCAPAFDNDLLPGFSEVMIDSAKEVAQRWSMQPEGTPVDMLNEMARLTARIIGRTVFGDDTKEEEAAQVVHGFTEYARHVEQLDLADTLGVPWLRFFGNPIRKSKTMLSAHKVHEIIDRIIKRHQQHKDNGQFTLLSLLLEGKTGKPGAPDVCPLGVEAARNEAIVMFMAGHETTANSLAWTWYLLDHAPKAMNKLHDELDQVLDGRTPSLADIEKLPFTQAVFEEAMRLYPPVPLLSRQARKADVINKKQIKPDSIILVVPWLLHRHEAYWEDPNSFRPERFMPDQPKPNKFCYLPFSVGHRVCLGKRFGLTEGILCLATLAQHFRPRIVPGHTVEIDCRLTLRPNGGLPMLLAPRNR